MVCCPHTIEAVEQVFGRMKAESSEKHDPSFTCLRETRTVINVGAILEDAAQWKPVNETFY